MTNTSEIEAHIVALDTEYQAAVKANDAATMDHILAEDFILATGRGKVYNKTDLINAAKNQDAIYEYQDDSQQTVRVWGDTAIITALLYQKGTYKGEPFEDHLWFSDVYIRTADGWKYAFGQASLRLPD
jgi:ketosteroid isomerase-like protein